MIASRVSRLIEVALSRLASDPMATKTARNEAIIAARSQGKSVAGIAMDHGITGTRVRQIIKRAQKRAEASDNRTD